MESSGEEHDLGTLKLLLHSLISDNSEAAGMLMADESDDPYGVGMVELATLLLTFHMIKDAGYGRSWAKHGEVGVYNNLMRKVDRMDTLGLIAMIGNKDNVSSAYRIAHIDVLVDLALYCMMWIAYIAKVRPGDFEDWIRDVFCKSSGQPFDKVAKFLGMSNEADTSS